MFKKRTAKIPEYSYRSLDSYKKEEAVVYRRIALIGFLTAIVLIVIFYWGITFVYGLGSFWEVFRGKKTETINATNIYRGINPRLDSLPAATNKERIDVGGNVADDLTVELFVNNNLYGKVISKESRFEFTDVKLRVGENTLKVVAKDGKESSEPAFTTITYDKAPPKLEVVEISNEVVYLDKQKEIPINGTTDLDATVTVNDFQAIVYPTGTFSYGLPLHAGQNSIKVTATDKAGNQSTVEKTVFAKETADPTATNSAIATGSVLATTSAQINSDEVQKEKGKKEKD